MAEQKLYNLNITDFVNGVIQQANLSRDAVKDEVVKYINTSPLFKSKIYAALARRLKISTGELAKSIRFTVFTVDDDKEPTGKTDIRGKKIYSFTSIISVKITVSNKLLPALLSGDELAKNPNSKDIPEISELVEWIRGKNKYFAGATERLDSLRNVALRKQRNILNSSKKVSASLNATYMFHPESSGDSSIETLAKTIRSRMKKRVAKGLPATKGSEFIFLGIYSQSQNLDIKNPALRNVPKYRKVADGHPLLTQNRKLKKQGEINEIVFDVIDKLIKKNLNNVVSKFKKGVQLETQLFASEKGGRVYFFDELESSFEYFQNIIESLGNTNTVASRKYSNKTKALYEEAENSAYSLIVTAKKDAGRKMDEIARDLRATVKFRGGYKIGRKAKRKR